MIFKNKYMKKKLQFILWAIFAIVLTANSRVNAANIIVTNNADAGIGSLRQAILIAIPGDKITFDLPARNETIIIQSQLPEIKVPLTIDGSNNTGSGTPVTVQVINPGISPFRVLYIADTIGTDTIENITIKGGDISSLSADSSYGGGILIYSGKVVLNSSFVSGSIANVGGGIYIDGEHAYSALVINSSIISGDSALGGGGGIYNKQAELHIISSNINSNKASLGGGIYSDGGKNLDISGSLIKILSSTIKENYASIGGGGIYNLGGQGGNIADLLIYSSTISENTVKEIGGGGIYNEGGGDGGQANVTIISSTLSENRTLIGIGGGIYNNANDAVNHLIIISSTISGNSSFTGGGVYSEDNYCSNYSYFLNSIIINNSDSTGDANIFIGETPFYKSYFFYCWYNHISGAINTKVNAPNDTTAYVTGNLDTLKINLPGTTATMATNKGCPAIDNGTFTYYNETDGYYFVDNTNVSHKLIDWNTSPIINPIDKIRTDQRGAIRYSPTTIGAYEGIHCENTTGDTTALAQNSFTWYGMTYTKTDTLTYVFIKTDGCDSTVTLHLTVIEGVHELLNSNDELGIRVYPNPTTNYIYV